MQKNIFIIQNTEIGGHLALSVFLTNLLKKYRSDLEFKFSLICGSIENEENIGDIRNNLDIYTTQTGLYKVKDNMIFSWKVFFLLKSAHKAKKIDILHVFYPNSSLLGALIFKLFCSWKTKIIYDVRSPWIEMSFANNHISKKMAFISNIMHASEYLLVRAVDEFVFITEGTKKYYFQKYHIHKKKLFSIIPSGVEVSDFQVSLSDNRKSQINLEMERRIDEIIIGYVGTISHMRELHIFVEKNAHIFHESNYKLIIIGDGDGIEKVKGAIDQNNLTGKVLLLGKKSRKEIPEYIACFDYGLCHLPDIFVFRNSFPLKILEYISAGKLVLCTDIYAHTLIKNVFIDQIILYTKHLPILKSHSDQINSDISNYDWHNIYKRYEHIYGNY